ncbi:MerR family transcriptional regulator [Gulosibacter faecalis]|uniref:Helix-turn-helix domain-containing protein n=1 Tax=Gulosibacter faecalis TaxID=272240 RepID=A0ABW5UW19_9MICO|nr:helix-turn-helix domain-containing protein [Gulosibacter faecalis]
MDDLLTTREAARRVGRSIRTIRYWRADGMDVYFDEHGHMRIELDELLTWYRTKTMSNPAHRYRLRKLGITLDLTAK